MDAYIIKIIIAAILASISCGIAGTYLVARRLVFIGGGITHASFGGIGLGYFLGINPILTALVVAIGAAIGVESISRRGRIREDTIIAVLWSLGMALGVLFMKMSAGYAPSLISFLFGSITAVSWLDISMLTGITAGVLTLLYFFLYPLIFHAFDPSFLSASQRNSTWMNYLMMGLVAAIMVFNVRMVGVVLLMALLTIPQMTINLFSKSFITLLWGSIVFSLGGTLGGLFMAWNFDLPSGVSIVLVQSLIYLLAWGLSHSRLSMRRARTEINTA